jgi:hypothetical protein|tara:strand:- start:203 stop:427 length:225 start_codon:yes stop_codon:yes gene_type:complete
MEKTNTNDKANKPQDASNQPIVKTTMRLSKDGKWFIHDTIIRNIKPVSYLNKVLQQELDIEDSSLYKKLKENKQ